MNVGVNTQVWTIPFRDQDLALLEPIASMGYAAIEMSYAETESTFDVQACRAELERRNLIPALCGFLDAGRDISSADAGAQKAGVEYLSRACEVVRELGGEIVCGPLYAELFRARDLSDADRSSEWERSVESMRKAAAVAEELGATIAIEPLNRFETDMVNTAQQALSYVNAVDSPAVRVHLDTFHMNIEESSLPDAIAAAQGRLAHFHACENDRGVPGTGHVDWSEVRDALRDAAYDGLVVFEGFNRSLPDLANGARIWRSLGGDPDEMARAAAGYLSEWVR